MHPDSQRLIAAAAVLMMVVGASLACTMPGTTADPLPADWDSVTLPPEALPIVFEPVDPAEIGVTLSAEMAERYEDYNSFAYTSLGGSQRVFGYAGWMSPMSRAFHEAAMDPDEFSEGLLSDLDFDQVGEPQIRDIVIGESTLALAVDVTEGYDSYRIEPLIFIRGNVFVYVVTLYPAGVMPLATISDLARALDERAILAQAE